jgi:hypothetical protein
MLACREPGGLSFVFNFLVIVDNLAYVHVFSPVRENCPQTVVPQTPFPASLGFGWTAGTDAGGYIRVAGPFPYSAMTHSNIQSQPRISTNLWLAITERRPSASDSSSGQAYGHPDHDTNSCTVSSLKPRSLIYAVMLYMNFIAYKIHTRAYGSRVRPLEPNYSGTSGPEGSFPDERGNRNDRCRRRGNGCVFCGPKMRVSRFDKPRWERKRHCAQSE